MEKVYRFREVEDKIYKWWLEKGFFRADIEKIKSGQKRPFCVMMPPPNVTGIIHLGHVLNNTLQDIIIRYKRMQGYEVLWQPGTDHAGIATQNVVEKQLAKEGKTRWDLGREKFLEKVWEWKNKYGNIIVEQLKKLGVSCDWSRFKFTLDKDMYKAVIEAFVRLYKEGLIYKGLYMINWCPRCGTALADDEVEREEIDGKLWYIKYPFVDGSSYITVATTRPETYLGDTAVAVNPQDERYKNIIGKKVKLPFVNWIRKGTKGEEVSPEIPIIADECVDMDFGTGAVKITPAHDFADWEIGKKHNLPEVIIMTKEAIMNENAGIFKGLDRYEAREKIVNMLKEHGFLEKVEDYKLVIGKCYRCGTVVEPYLSEEWFVKMEPLAKMAKKVVEEGKIKIIPEFWKKVYYHWLDNVRDWCISRKIWWGHRIPVWYCKDCGHLNVSVEEPTKCEKCGSKNLVQDEDVLDTWFSSWLWPFSTLGWPKDTEELKVFYPTDILITGWDILFFWVARMIMAGLFFMKDIPFRYVYLNGLIRDEKRRKMSKSLGNSPDPLDLFKEYGVDGVRMGLMLISPEGKDVIFSLKRMEVGRNFANKIWNASRLLYLNLDKNFEYKGLPQKEELCEEDEWILYYLDRVIKFTTEGIEKFDFNGVAKELFDFFWHKFCDWYLEVIKVRIRKGGKEKENALNIALFVLDKVLRLLHPYMPFITEEIWQKFPFKDAESIMISKWPEPLNQEFDYKKFEFIKQIIEQIREIRGIFKIKTSERLPLYAKISEIEDIKDLIERKAEIFYFLAKVEKIEYSEEFPKPSGAIFVGDRHFALFLKDVIDATKEKQRIEKEIKDLEKRVSSLEKRLKNTDFLEKAPYEIIEREEKRLKDFKKKIEVLRNHLKYL